MTRISLIVLACILMFGAGFAQTQPFVQLILDASGSMHRELATDESRIDGAKRVVTEFVAGLPDDGLNLGIRLYGATTGAFDTDACTDSQLAVVMNGVAKEAIFEAVRGVNPRGGTPIIYALEQATADFEAVPADAARRIILVTDGADSCGGDVAAAVQAVIDRGIDLRVIGFALDAATAQAFSALGAFENALDTVQLATALEATTADLLLPTQAGDQERTDVVHLVTGDSLTGAVSAPISVNASFGTIQIDPNNLLSIVIGSDGEAELRTLAGDVVFGTIASPTIGFFLRAAQAEVEIVSDQVTSITFSAGAAEPLLATLPDAAFTASSFLEDASGPHLPANARFSAVDTPANWATSGQARRNEWIMVDLGKVTRLRAVATMGRANCEDCSGNQWVVAYLVSHSVNGENWEFYSFRGTEVTFAGNIDHLTPVRHDLPTPVVARYVRFHPIQFNGHPSMRIEVYGERRE